MAVKHYAGGQNFKFACDPITGWYRGDVSNLTAGERRRVADGLRKMGMNDRSPVYREARIRLVKLLDEGVWTRCLSEWPEPRERLTDEHLTAWRAKLERKGLESLEGYDPHSDF